MSAGANHCMQSVVRSASITSLTTPSQSPARV
jgi:hypothetical protein